MRISVPAASFLFCFLEQVPSWQGRSRAQNETKTFPPQVHINVIFQAINPNLIWRESTAAVPTNSPSLVTREYRGLPDSSSQEELLSVSLTAEALSTNSHSPVSIPERLIRIYWDLYSTSKQIHFPLQFFPFHQGKCEYLSAPDIETSEKIRNCHSKASFHCFLIYFFSNATFLLNQE